ncbi:MAG: hypothetical protein KC729_06425, partial [Candidatus Eisenbacteria bacterium]|nr:hypothetical protein [Candidatus Eisenbacteria bacterium]
ATLVLAQTSGSVIVNGQPVPESVLGQLAQQYRVQIPAGRYWYDPACGAWGLEGGPAAGITMAGISLGGPLRVDASGGSARGFVTGVFINGREIHPIDYQALCQLVPVGPGRYWVDAWGNAGYEGMPAAINLWQLAQSRGGGGRGYHHAGPGGYTGSDGNTFYFFDPETGSSVMSN